MTETERWREIARELAALNGIPQPLRDDELTLDRVMEEWRCTANMARDRLEQLTLDGTMTRGKAIKGGRQVTVYRMVAKS